ncbi:MAG: hypothetical protein KA054_03040 [Candidatus Moranbacteria bacterium]|nr:hypothetical protein [Candidatus Moranbacteria bacterium]
MRTAFYYPPSLTDVVELLRSSGQRRYTVTAKIVFEFAMANERVNPIVLGEAVLAAHNKSPWVDDAKPGERVIYIGAATYAGNNGGSVWFSVSPGQELVLKGQVSGYESYLMRMVAELRRKQLTGVSNVRAVIETIGLIN